MFVTKKLKDRIEKLEEENHNIKTRYNGLVEHLKLREHLSYKRLFTLYGCGFFDQIQEVTFSPIQKCPKCKKEL